MHFQTAAHGKSRYLSIALIFLFGLLSILASGGGGGGGGNGSGDTMPPQTSASPPGGLYGSTQDVTLTSDEAATIYYSLDGNDPSIGGGNTASGSSPVSGIVIPGGTTVLKYFAVDAANNQEVVKSETYEVDLQSPSLSLSGSPPAPVGLLGAATVNWQTDEDGSYIVELGGNGTMGSGVQLAAGTAQANTPIASQVQGVDLSYAAAMPLWVYVTDAVGNIGSFSIDLHLKPLVTIAVGSGMADIKILPDGLKAYATKKSLDSVAVIDIDPASMNYNTILTSIAVGTRPDHIAVTPDGAWLYVTNNGNTDLDIDSISEIATATDTVSDTITLNGNTAPTGIAVTPDGTRAYFLSFEEKIQVLDADTASGTYNTVIGNIGRTLLLAGEIAITPDGLKAVANWFGLIAHAVDVLDVDPASPTYNTLLASPIPVVSASSGDIAISSDSAYAYVTDTYFDVCWLCKIDLQTYAITAKNNTDASSLQDAVALTPDDAVLLAGGVNTTSLSLFGATDLSLLGSVDIGSAIASMAITPDGSRAYVVEFDISGNADVIMVPLQ